VGSIILGELDLHYYKQGKIVVDVKKGKKKSMISFCFWINRKRTSIY